jgi:hypothetical protein
MLGRLARICASFAGQFVRGARPSWQWGLLPLLLASVPALARDDGQWSNQPPEIRKWFESVMQPNNRASCCGEADAFDVALDGEDTNGNIRAIILNGRGLYPDGTLILVPHEKLQVKYGNPLDKVILFIGVGGRPICLIPKTGT